MIKMSCPDCEAVRDVEEVHSREHVSIKGKEVEFDAVACKCTVCGKTFETMEQMDANLLAAREAYTAKYEAVTPDFVRNLREKYNASQKAFGLILGMGELTINSYEAGKAVPSSTNRLLLQLAEHPLVFCEMYEKNKDKIGMTQRKRIESSACYTSVCRWGGIETLYQRLSAQERDELEGRTNILNGKVVNVVVPMVQKGLQYPKSSPFSDTTDDYADAVSVGTLSTSIDQPA
jgi:putative zinc finger/helix-turn-helix YgiT family protein